jgi:hypothetical protein
MMGPLRRVLAFFCTFRRPFNYCARRRMRAVALADRIAGVDRINDRAHLGPREVVGNPSHPPARNPRNAGGHGFVDVGAGRIPIRTWAQCMRAHTVCLTATCSSSGDSGTSRALRTQRWSPRTFDSTAVRAVRDCLAEAAGRDGESSVRVPTSNRTACACATAWLDQCPSGWRRLRAWGTP